MPSSEPAHPPPDSGAPPRWSMVLRAVREARGVTLDGWAARIGVSRATVQRWERGTRVPDPGAEAAILAYCQDTGLFRAYDRGPLAGLHLSADMLRDLLAEARWRGYGAPPTAEPQPAPAPPPPPVDRATGEPVGALPAPPTNLPVQLTSFIGRERELTAVRRVQAGSRVLTLTGPGGCGKTRLALAVAGELLPAYPHGVWFIDLAPLPPVGLNGSPQTLPSAEVMGSLQTLDDPALMPQAVASVLAIRPSGTQPLTATLCDALRARHLLLVLDNCEHVLTACAALVETLIRACPKVSVLATSREPLGIPGEAVWRVPPLAVPIAPSDADQRGPTAGGGEATDAVRLFAERARLQQPDLVLGPGEVAAVGEICRRLDGMPLAIELAAARVSVLSVAQIAARLADRFALLTGGGRTALPRQQTLRATMDWSYDLLTLPEQALLRALSVFAGGFTLEAAEAVCGDGAKGKGPRAIGEWVSVPIASILDLLARLVDKSLVAVEERSGRARYRLLETVRQYTAERLAAAGELQAMSERHAAWCLALAEAAWPHHIGPEQDRWLERLHEEHDNLRAALGWSLGTGGDVAVGLRIAAHLWWLWEVRGHLSEGRRWLGALLARGRIVPPDVLARALEGAGKLAQEQGDYDGATRAYEQCLDLWRELGDDRGIAAALNLLGIVADQQGDFVRAQAHYEECLAVGRRLRDPMRVAASLNNLGIVARQRGEPERAIALYEESLAIVRELGDTRRMAMMELNLGNAYQDLGVMPRAVARYRESLMLYGQLQDQTGAARALQGMAAVAVACGEAARAARLAGAVAALRAAVGVHVPAFGRARFDETTAAARAALGEAEFGTAWAAGESLSLEGAIAEALAVSTVDTKPTR